METDTFAHLTDFHFWQVVLNPFRLMGKRFLGNANVIYKRRHEFAAARAEPYVDYVLAQGVNTAVLTGDFTSTSTTPEFKAGAAMAQRLADAGLTVYAIPGNHDVYTWASKRTRRFERYFDAWYPEEGLPAKRTLPGGHDLVFVPTVTPDIQSRGRITDVEVEGVRELLRTATDPVVVAGHYPLLHETYAYTAPPPRQLRNAAALRDALGASGKAVLYIAGHVHRFSYVIDPQYDNLRHVTSGAFFRTATESDRTGDFSIVSVGGGDFEVVRHSMGGEWRAERAEPRAP